MKLTPAERGRWKFRLGSLGLGVLTAGAVFGASLAVSDDLRLMYLVGVIVLFCGATWMGAKSWRDWLSLCLLLKLCGSGRAYKTGATSNLLSWARTPVATHQNACALSPGGSTLPFPSLSIREKKRTPHLV